MGLNKGIYKYAQDVLKSFFLKRTDEAPGQLEKDGRTKWNVHRLPTALSAITTSPDESQEIVNAVGLYVTTPQAFDMQNLFRHARMLICLTTHLEALIFIFLH